MCPIQISFTEHIEEPIIHFLDLAWLFKASIVTAKSTIWDAEDLKSTARRLFPFKRKRRRIINRDPVSKEDEKPSRTLHQAVPLPGH